VGDGVRRWMVIVGVGALAATLVVASVPGLRFAYVSPTTRVAMETAQLVVTGIVGLLVHGRLRRSRTMTDLLLLLALGTSMLSNLFTVVVRAVSEERDTLTPFAAWSSLSMSLGAAALYLLSARAPGQSVPERLRSPWSPPALVAGTGAVILTVAALASPWLPRTVTGTFDVIDPARPTLDIGIAALVVHLSTLVLYLLAAHGFARQAGGRDLDPLLGALAVGLVLGAVARLNFVLYPSIHTTVVHTGDIVRLGFYLVLLAGAVGEISAYWRDRAQLAVLDERRRIARDLHDGVMQELSFIRSQVSAFRNRPPEPVLLDFVVAAAESALAESRRAVRALTDATADALDAVVRRTVAEVADRSGLAVRYDLAPGLHLSAAVTEQVRRIAREAVTNTVKHGRAEAFTVSMRPGARTVRLVFADDGIGFDTERPSEGFGLRGMRERVARIDGRLTVAATPGEGARIEVELPVEYAETGDAQVARDDVDQSGSVA
jgi:signal transduction histidine kinase